ncbi:hypothetical protein ACC713_38035, partial [Rhizobium johnstonii]
GEVMVNGETYGATRDETLRNRVRFIPEEPLQNACAPSMTVSENLAFRTFDLKLDGEEEEAVLTLKSEISAEARFFMLP